MFLIVTRNFPPDVGGMQILIGGLSEILLNHGPVKVFTYEYPNSNTYDSKSSINIERIRGIKLFRKYRKANLINNFISVNPNIRALIADHWKSLELIKTEYFKKIETFCLLHSKEINHEVGSSLNIDRIKGIKLFRKYRKANLINSFISTNPNIRALIADHWKSLELIKTENFKNIFYIIWLWYSWENYMNFIWINSYFNS